MINNENLLIKLQLMHSYLKNNSNLAQIIKIYSKVYNQITVKKVKKIRMKIAAVLARIPLIHHTHQIRNK